MNFIAILVLATAFARDLQNEITELKSSLNSMLVLVAQEESTTVLVSEEEAKEAFDEVVQTSNKVANKINEISIDIRNANDKIEKQGNLVFGEYNEALGRIEKFPTESKEE